MMVEDRPGSQRVATLAETLARALDAEDYGAVAPCIAEQCVYETATASVLGAGPIVAPHAAPGAWVKRTFTNISALYFRALLRVRSIQPL